jgi:hypothetical protein
MIDYKDPKAVLEVCGKATEGPWEIKKTDEGIECPLCGGEGEVDAVNIDGDGWTTIIQSYGIGEMIKNNADFIALARTALPYWAKEAERLRAENARLREENDIQRAGIQELSRGAIIPPAPWNCLFCGFSNLQRHEVCKRCGKERQG